MENEADAPRPAAGRGPKAKVTAPGLQRLLAAPLLGGVWVYQHLISPLTPASCRFTPTCSAYAAEAIRRHGPAKGLRLALNRIGRCHPWGGSGYDPVPD